MTQYIAGGILALILLSGVVILALLYTDRLPLPKQPPERELTEFEKASQELANNMTQLQRQIAVAMEPVVRKTTEALNQFAKTFTKSDRSDSEPKA